MPITRVSTVEPASYRPFPSSPNWLTPAHQIVPRLRVASTRKHVWFRPTPTLTAPVAAVTATGRSWFSVEPIPSLPESFEPQHSV